MKKIFESELPTPPPGCLTSAQHRREALKLAEKIEGIIERHPDHPDVAELRNQVAELYALAAEIGERFYSD